MYVHCRLPRDRLFVSRRTAGHPLGVRPPAANQEVSARCPCQQRPPQLSLLGL